MNTEKLEKMSVKEFKKLETLKGYFEGSLERIIEEENPKKVEFLMEDLEKEAKEDAIGSFLDNLNDMSHHDCMETLLELVNEL